MDADHDRRREHQTDEGHRQHRRVRPLPPPAAVRGGPGLRHRRGQGHPVGGLPRRGHHHHGGRGGPTGPASVPGRGTRRPCGSPPPRPAYLDKTNATTIHAALRQPADGGRLRLRRRPPVGGRAPCGPAWTRPAPAPPWWCCPTCATGCPPRPTRRPAATGRPPCWWATTAPGTPVIAEYLGGASVSDEFLDRWRTPGDRRSKVWEERFGETRYVPLGTEAWESALKAAGVDRRAGRPGGGHRHARPGGQGPRPASSGCATGSLADDLATTVGPDRVRPRRPGAGLDARAVPNPARWWPWCRWPTAPTCWCSAPPRPSPSGRRPIRWPTRSPRPPTSPTASS